MFNNTLWSLWIILQDHIPQIGVLCSIFQFRQEVLKTPTFLVLLESYWRTLIEGRSQRIILRPWIATQVLSLANRLLVILQLEKEYSFQVINPKVGMMKLVLKSFHQTTSNTIQLSCPLIHFIFREPQLFSACFLLKQLIQAKVYDIWINVFFIYLFIFLVTYPVILKSVSFSLSFTHALSFSHSISLC